LWSPLILIFHDVLPHVLHSSFIGIQCTACTLPRWGNTAHIWAQSPLGVCMCCAVTWECTSHTHLLTVCLPLLSFLATFITSGVGRHRHRAGNKRKSLTGTLPYEDQILSLRENCAVVKIDKRKRWKVRTLTQPDKTDPVAHLRHAGMSRLCCAQWH